MRKPGRHRLGEPPGTGLGERQAERGFTQLGLQNQRFALIPSHQVDAAVQQRLVQVQMRGGSVESGGGDGALPVALREKTQWQMLYESAVRADEVLCLNVEDAGCGGRSQSVSPPPA